LFDGDGAALEDFEDNGALELGVVGEVDDAAAAGSELANQLIVADGAFHGSVFSVPERW
jgi:hypothetical protein